MSEPRQSEDQIPRSCIRLGRCRTIRLGRCRTIRLGRCRTREVEKR